MAANRRAFSEVLNLDESEEAIDINNLNDEQLRELAQRAGYEIEDKDTEEEEDDNDN